MKILFIKCSMNKNATEYGYCPLECWRLCPLSTGTYFTDSRNRTGLHLLDKYTNCKILPISLIANNMVSQAYQVILRENKWARRSQRTVCPYYTQYPFKCLGFYVPSNTRVKGKALSVATCGIYYGFHDEFHCDFHYQF